MLFPAPLTPGTLIKRYKRFLADVRLGNGDIITAHCANPGAMTGLNMPGLPVLLSRSDNPKRKLKYSWELTQVDDGGGPVWVGINTAHPNALVAEAIAAGTLADLAGYDTMRREVRYGKNSRVDILLESDGKPPCYVEVKNVHLMRRPGLAEFPDSVTARGAKHLAELAAMVEAGNRALMVYLVQRPDAARLSLAADIDPAYARAFADAQARGVEAMAIGCTITPDEIIAQNMIPIEFA